MARSLHFPKSLAWVCALALFALCHPGCSGGGSSGGGGGPAPATVGPSGGTVSLGNGVTVRVPAGAVSSPTAFAARTGPDIDPATLPLSGMVLAGQPFQLEPAGQQFAVPVEVTVPYQAGSGFTADDLLGAHREDGTGAVDLLPPSDGTTGTVTLSLSHFSTVQAVRSSASPPGVTSVDPAIARVGSQAVTVFGNGFKDGPGLQVFFGGVAAVSTSVQFVSSTEIRAVASAATPGTVDVRVKNGDGLSFTLGDGYTAVDSLALQSVQPSSASAGSTTTVRLTGAGFYGTPTITVGGLQATSVQVVSQTTLDCDFPDDLTGSKDVVVTTPDGSTVTSSGAFNRTPALYGITPSVGPIGGMPVTVNGAGFTAGVTILVDGQALVGQAVTSNTTITGTMPSVTTPRRASVQASSPVGSSPTTVAFDYGLTVVGVTPAGGVTAGGAGITITGTGFTSGATFQLGGAVISGTVQDSTTFVGTTPAGSAGPADLQVTATHGSATLTNAYYYGPPSVQAIVPNEVVLNQATGVTIRGAGFYEGITGTVGGQALADLAVVDSSTLVAVTTQPVAGSQDVIVTNGGGNGTLLGGVSAYAASPTPWRAVTAGLDGSTTVPFRYSLAAGAPNTFFVATYGGLYRSSNAGLTWQSVTPPIDPPATYAVAVSPVSTQLVFVVTEGGVYRSTDEGDSWVLVTSGSTDVDVICHPSDPDIAFAIGFAGGYFCERTLDGGNTWAAFGPSDTSSIALAPSDPLRMVVGLGLNKAWSADGGATWTTVTSNLRRGALRFDPLDSSVVWHVTTDGVERSSDGGDTWTLVLGTGGAGSGGGFRCVAVAPTTPRRVYVGTRGRQGEQVLVSDDAGVTWTSASTGLEGRNLSELLVDPSAASTIYAGLSRGGGVMKSTDAGGSWFAARAGLNSADLTAFAAAPSPSRRLYAFLDQTPRFSTNGGLTWIEAEQASTLEFDTNFMGRERDAVVDSSNPLVAYLTGASVYKTTDGGRSWSDPGTLPAGKWFTDLEFDSAGALYVCYSNDGTPAEHRVMKSTNAGLNWSHVDSGLPLDGSSFRVRPAPSDPNTVYCFGPGVYRSTDGAANWTQVFSASTTDLLVDYTNKDRLFRLEGATVYASQDGGTSWMALSASTWTTPSQLLLEPGANGTLYVVDDDGRLFKSKDAGVTWAVTLPAGSTSSFETRLHQDPSRPGTLYLNSIFARTLLKSTTGGE